MLASQRKLAPEIASSRTAEVAVQCPMSSRSPPEEATLGFTFWEYVRTKASARGDITPIERGNSPTPSLMNRRVRADRSPAFDPPALGQIEGLRLSCGLCGGLARVQETR